MKINSINKSTSFCSKTALPPSSVLSKQLKRVKDVPCACCGKKVITTESITQAFRVIAKPLSKMLESGSFKFWKTQKDVWRLLENYAKAFPDKSLDKILENDANYTELKTTVALSEKCNNEGRSFIDVINRSRKDLRGAGAVMKRLAPFKEYLTGTKLQTFEQLQIYAKKYPRKSLSEIINMDEIYKYHSTKDLLQRAETNEKRNFHFGNIKELILKKSPDLSEKVEEIQQNVIDFYTEIDDSKRRIYTAKKMYSDFLKENKLENLKTKIFSELEQIPQTFITKDSFLAFAKNHEFSDLEIVYSLLNPYVSSFEHIVPISKKGEDSIYNGMILCRKCNSNRSNIPYTEYLNYHPEMSYNTQKQFDFLSKVILEGKLSDDFRVWPMRVAKTLSDYTDNRLSPDVSQYCNKSAKKTRENVAVRNDTIENMKKQIQENLERKRALLDEIAQLEEDNKLHDGSIRSINKDNNRDNGFIAACERYVKGKSQK